MGENKELEFRYEVVARIFRDRRMPSEHWKKRLTSELDGLGDSLDIYITPSGKKAVIHIHTNAPEKVKSIIFAFSMADTTPRFEEQDLEEQIREVRNA